MKEKKTQRQLYSSKENRMRHKVDKVQIIIVLRRWFWWDLASLLFLGGTTECSLSILYLLRQPGIRWEFKGGKLKVSIGGGHGDLLCCGVVDFFCAVLRWSQTVRCAVFFILKLWCSEKKYLCGVVVYCLTHLTNLPVPLSNCRNLFIFVKPSFVTFWEQRHYQICQICIKDIKQWMPGHLRFHL